MKKETLKEQAERIKMETAYEEEPMPQDWAELHGAYQDSQGEWVV